MLKHNEEKKLTTKAMIQCNREGINIHAVIVLKKENH